MTKAVVGLTVSNFFGWTGLVTDVVIGAVDWFCVVEGFCDVVMV